MLLIEQLKYAKRTAVPPGVAVLATTQTGSETETELKKLDRLREEGVNWYSLVEFDTVVNQCLVYRAG